jgi:hypothetical protein
MNINPEKSLLIEQIKLVDDEALINTIKDLLDYSLKKQTEEDSIPAKHQQLIIERAKSASSENFISIEESNKALKEKYGI